MSEDSAPPTDLVRLWCCANGSPREPHDCMRKGAPQYETTLNCGFCGHTPDVHGDSDAGPMTVCPRSRIEPHVFDATEHNRYCAVCGGMPQDHPQPDGWTSREVLELLNGDATRAPAMKRERQAKEARRG